MKLIKELKRLEKSLAPTGINSVFFYENDIPTARFTNFVIAIHLDRLVVVTVRGSFNSDFADALIEKTTALSQDLGFPNPIECRSGALGAFTQVCFLGPNGHKTFATYSEELKCKTIVAFPAFSCEFAGDEDAEIIKLLRRDFIDTIDWKRNPQPQLKMRYENKTKGIGSKGKQLGFASICTLREVLEGLKECEGFVDLENVKHERLRIEAKRQDWLLTHKKTKKEERLAFAIAIEHALKFVGAFDGSESLPP